MLPNSERNRDRAQKNLSPVKARCCGAVPAPPDKSTGLEARKNLGSETSVFEALAEFRRFSQILSTADAYREAGRGSGGVGTAP